MSRLDDVVSAARSLPKFVEAHLLEMRAPLKERTMFGPAGRCVLRSKGERTIYGPNGEPIKIVEDEFAGVQVEHGEHLHAVVRPRTVTKGARAERI